jgi:hypothetical protein
MDGKYIQAIVEKERQSRFGLPVKRGALGLVEDLEAELDDARLEGAGDLTAGTGGLAVGSSDGAGEVEVGMVEDVVELRPEFDFEAVDRGGELLVE